MKHEMAKLSKKNFEMKKPVGGLIVILFVIMGSQMAVDSLSSGLRCLTTGYQGQ
jgi:hypothetical protein